MGDNGFFTRLNVGTGGDDPKKFNSPYKLPRLTSKIFLLFGIYLKEIVKKLTSRTLFCWYHISLGEYVKCSNLNSNERSLFAFSSESTLCRD